MERGLGVLRGQATTGRFFKALGVSLHGVEMPEHVRHCVLDCREEGIGCVGETVMNPQAFTSRLDQPCLSKIRKMPRYLRLRQLQTLVDIADADLASQQQPHDAKSGGIAERLKQPAHAVEVIPHTYAFANIARWVTSLVTRDVNWL